MRSAVCGVRARTLHAAAHTRLARDTTIEHADPRSSTCAARESARRRAYLERWRIFLRLRWRRRVRFFFHFQRFLEWAFFHGLDLWPPPRRRSTRCRVDSFWML